MARGIKAKLAELSTYQLQSHYNREAKYLLQTWPGYIRVQVEPAAWAIAKDFAERFPRHSYAEWAYAFGIPKDHAVIQHFLYPIKVASHREAYNFRMHMLQWTLLCATVLSITLPDPYNWLLFLACAATGLCYADKLV